MTSNTPHIMSVDNGKILLGSQQIEFEIESHATLYNY